jgi:hypothetical protein
MKRLSVVILKNHKFFCSNTHLKYNTDNFKIIDNNKPINNINYCKLEENNSKSGKYNYSLDDKKLNKQRLESATVGFCIISIIYFTCIFCLNPSNEQQLAKIFEKIIVGYIVISMILFINIMF